MHPAPSEQGERVPCGQVLRPGTQSAARNHPLGPTACTAQCLNALKTTKSSPFHREAQPVMLVSRE